MARHRSGRQPKTYVKLEAAFTVFEFLMTGGVSPATCWAIKKHWNNKLHYTVASCWFFLWDLYYDARIHEHQVGLNIYSPFGPSWLVLGRTFVGQHLKNRSLNTTGRYHDDIVKCYWHYHPYWNVIWYWYFWKGGLPLTNEIIMVTLRRR
jgi:hypothetical protein